LYAAERNIELLLNGKTSNTNNEKNNAKTPINLFGIDRNIAYDGKKYHSGTICSGVTIGLPSM
jgi:hypothetical protein